MISQDGERRLQSFCPAQPSSQFADTPWTEERGKSQENVRKRKQVLATRGWLWTTWWKHKNTVIFQWKHLIFSVNWLAFCLSILCSVLKRRLSFWIKERGREMCLFLKNKPEFLPISLCWMAALSAFVLNYSKDKNKTLLSQGDWIFITLDPWWEKKDLLDAEN